MGLFFNREPEEKTKTFTRHTSRIQYIDGTEETVVWDQKLHKTGGLLVFYKYTGDVDTRRITTFDKRLLFSVGTGTIKKFETIDREKKEFTYAE